MDYNDSAPPAMGIGYGGGYGHDDDNSSIRTSSTIATANNNKGPINPFQSPAPGSMPPPSVTQKGGKAIVFTSEDRKFESSLVYQNMKKRIDDLELALLDSAAIVEYERTRSKENMTKIAKLESDNENLSRLNDNLNSLNKSLDEELSGLRGMKDKGSTEITRLQNLLLKASNEITGLEESSKKAEGLLKSKNDECEELLGK
jgi:hypothetical protein